MVRGRAASGPGRTPPAHLTAAVVALFTALTLLTTYPLWLHPASTMLPGGPDGELFVWTLSWDAHAFLHQPFAIFDANIYHPLRDTLAFSENLIGTAIFSAPIQWLTGNPVFALNVVSLLSTLLCGVGTWLLARRLGLEQGAALFFTLQVLSSGHGAAFMAIACGGLLVYRASLGEPLRAWRRVRDLGVAGLLLFAAQPGSFAIAEVPLPDPVNPGEFERRQTAYMMHASAHWQKTVHGYSGFRTLLHERLFQHLRAFPSDGGLRRHTDVGVSRVVVHTDLYEPGEWAAVEARIGRFPDRLRLEHVEGAGRVYSLWPPAPQ